MTSSCPTGKVAAARVGRSWKSGAVSVSAATVRRWLTRDAIKPWQYRSWIFPRDPDFTTKAERVLDLHQRRWNGRKLGPDEYVISSDEKTSIQARCRCHPTLPPGKARMMRVNHEYERGGSSHRGQTAIDRLANRFPNAVMVHTPLHASWLNQVEIYFSVVQRKVVSPNDFADLHEVEQRLTDFAKRYNATATPFHWKFTRHDLHDLLARISQHEQQETTELPTAA
jgi:hypothetical protein